MQVSGTTSFPPNGGTSVYGTAAVERSAGRVEMARRRIEQTRERIWQVLWNMSAELDRLQGPQPTDDKAQGLPPKPSGELFALDAEADALESVLGLANLVASRLTNI